jgi:mercuric reductase
MIEEALVRLNTLLPLSERQKALSPAHKKIHQAILNDFVNTGSVQPAYDKASLDVLSQNDLIVLDAETGEITGAYPFSIKHTPHHVFMNDFVIYAMCAFDAIAIAPVFNQTTSIKSVCHVTNDMIEIKQAGTIINYECDSMDVHVGIRWQSPGGCAAESLCMEMVFLKNENTAQQWVATGHEKSVFNLNDAIDFATRFFMPLIEN